MSSLHHPLVQVAPVWGQHGNPEAAAQLVQVLPSVLGVLGVPGQADSLGLGGRVHHACVLLIDGLGTLALEAHADHAPFLTGLARSGQHERLRVGFPSTTATSVGSFGTGVMAGEHGLVGYEVVVPGQQRVINTLKWDETLTPDLWQPVPTVFEQARPAGLQVTQVVPEKFVGSGFSQAALRGGLFAVGESVRERVEAAAQAMATGRPGLTYVYFGDLDATGHEHGVDSPQWRAQLRIADQMAAQLAAHLPTESGLWVTADHGMVDIAGPQRVDIAAHPLLHQHVHLVGGEARARYLYCDPQHVEQVVDVWRDAYGDQAWVVTRQEAVQAGWFGPTVSPQALPRIGDVIVAAHEPLAFVDSRTDAASTLELVGMHGSFTPDEVYVPLREIRS